LKNFNARQKVPRGCDNWHPKATGPKLISQQPGAMVPVLAFFFHALAKGARQSERQGFPYRGFSANRVSRRHDLAGFTFRRVIASAGQ
jgi:hypothetical protein